MGAQRLLEVLLVEALRVTGCTSEKRFDLLTLPVEDVVQVVRRRAEPGVLDALDRLEKEHALVLSLLRIRGVRTRAIVALALCRLERQKPQVLLVGATEVRVHRASDSLSDARAPEREQRLTLLPRQRRLGAHRAKELVRCHVVCSLRVACFRDTND